MSNSSSTEISQSLTENVTTILDQLGNSQDIQIRNQQTTDAKINYAIIFIDGISNSETIEEQVIKPLKNNKTDHRDSSDQISSLSELVQTKTVKISSKLTDIIDELIVGNTVILVDGADSSIIANTTKWPERSLETPQAQRIPKGPNVAFNESTSQNLGLIRRILRNPKLRVETDVCSSKVKTQVTLLYIEGKIQPEVLQEIKKKMKEVEVEVLLDSSYLEEMMTSEVFTDFPLTLSSDRPDVVCSELLEGKASIIVDGSPFVITLPTVISQFFQSPEDYYTLTKGVSFKRVYRMIFYAVSIILPGLYISFTVHHPGLVPSKLLISIVAQREIVPFPTVLEVLIFFILIQIITESSLRLPQSMVLTVSVFGAIILGQSVVEAKLVQPTTLVVMSASYILASVIPVYSLRPVANRLTLRFIILSGFLGLYGIMLGILYLLLHLTSLRSFGVPYLSPIAPFNMADQKDNILREDLDNIMNNPKKFTLEEPTKKRK
ncbi:spore germination protein [Metabacillus litoralis]|uniref:spore germination protein n=1 Tax=Metabacillus litoralis TaxID=152268 RepID=UPI001CFC5699|nr:spore germination protein [Metabacillus litoralis]